jgi:hypothetical protein
MYLSEALDKIPKNEIHKIWIRLDSNMVKDYERHGDGAYDYSWSGSGSPELNSTAYLNSSATFGYEQFPVWSKNEIKSGDMLYVLWCVYSTGDTFGHSDGNCEALMVYSDPELAKKALLIWKKTDQERTKDYTYSIMTPFTDDVMISVSNPGAGYFNDLTDVKLSLVQVV